MNPQPCTVCDDWGPQRVCAACMIESICEDERKAEFCDAWRDLQEQEGWVSL